MIDGLFNGPARIFSGKFQTLTLSFVLDDNMIASIGDPKFVPFSNQFHGPVGPLPLEPVAQLVEGGEKTECGRSQGQQLGEVHVTPEYILPFRNLDCGARIRHLQALNTAARRIAHPLRLSESPHV